MAIPPSRQRVRERQGGGLEHAASDGPCEGVGGERAQLGQALEAIDQGDRTGRSSEDDVAVQRGVGRTQAASEAVVGGDREALGLRLGQRGVGRHKGDGGRGRAALEAQPERIVGGDGGQAEAAELGVPFVRRGPEMRAVADVGLAESVDGGDGADAQAGAGDRAR